MKFTPRDRAARALLVLGAALGFACDSTTPPVAETGSIRVTSFTAGVDLDDEYSVFVDDSIVAVIAANGSVLVEGVVAGVHDVKLVDVADNCSAGAARNQVDVTPGQSAVTAFILTCVARAPQTPPSHGTVRIATVTSGVDRDADGYTALISDFVRRIERFLPVNGTVEIDLAAGRQYFIALSEIAPNCRIQTSVSTEQVVNIVADVIASVNFSIACEPVYPARLPAGSQLAFVRNGGIHLVNSDGTGLVRLTDGPSDCDPSWSPDGLRLAFVRGCQQSGEIYTMNADGTNRVRRAAGFSPSWSPDGRRLVFSSLSAGSLNLFVIASDDDGKAAVELVDWPGWDGHPTWSPDGSRIAFVSDWVAYDFTSDVFVTPVDSGKGAQLTSGFNFWPNLTQYFQPAWSPDGARLVVVRCPQAYYTCDHSTIVLMNADGSGVTPVVATRGFARPTWSPDGAIIAFSSAGTVGWVRVSTTERGFIVADGESPAWRPILPH